MGAVVLHAISSAIRSLLWALNAALAIIIVALVVAPVSTTANMASWLSLVGLMAPSKWLFAHAQAGIHLSLRPLFSVVGSECTRSGCATAPTAFDLYISEIALIGAVGIAACSLLLWLLPKTGRLLQVLRSDWFHTHGHTA